MSFSRINGSQGQDPWKAAENAYSKIVNESHQVSYPDEFSVQFYHTRASNNHFVINENQGQLDDLRRRLLEDSQPNGGNLPFQFQMSRDRQGK